ncbi:serrate RNA effector molecule homolog isoform X2 [Artemia franciscana]|uniref:Serrate RNA effector molecule homolog n=1 Tax=Artemia franciscana TaxID=6661 RepID=A0AA88HC70_ARTSF|nr:hypothetical protein QYM36_016998 [Artemia franciscana]KAK2704798.1 hypothetical protein QYM36_016998 [Artemia franciscana]KAK2704799.1 hypothetical protein QYM36_016998 [Artemia franciscana]
MGDSDDDQKSRGRDKFRGERSEFSRGSSSRGDSYNDDRYSSRRPDPRDIYRGRDRHSPAYSQDYHPSKRQRGDWDDRRHDYGSSGFSSYGQESYSSSFQSSTSRSTANDDTPTQPPMMSFKAFLAAQDDSISDEEAITKYADYKLEFRRQQINEFFVAHKDEEWFKIRYHPEESVKRKEEQLANLNKRVEAFKDFFEKGRISGFTLDADQSEKIVKFLDAFVIKLEGGSDEEIEEFLSEVSKPVGLNPEATDKSGSKKDEGKRDESDAEIQDETDPKALSEARSLIAGNGEGVKRKRPESESGQESATDDEKPPGTKAEEPEETPKETSKVPKKIKHKTSSIFLRNLAPTITKAEVESMCQRYPGFLRAAIADPQSERRWFRRGWVTFERDVPIKEICWNLNNIRLRDCELGAIVNRDLSRRIRTVNGITSHKTVVRNDIRLAARIIQNLDSRFGLWQNKDEKEQPKSELEPFSMHSTNPVLKKITDYLIEEASAEEEALLGTSADPEEGENTEDNHSIQRDEELMSVLDRLLIYLRLVHSVDFYNHSEYPNEDEMPNRCGILHARGIPPSSKVTSQELNDYCQQFEKKISPFLQAISKLSDEEGAKLGLKDENTEVEKFITANTQELGKDKWLCPLSGKKFKGPDFVRKHIFNKHVEKIDEVKKEVEYFNNYLRDPKRPQLPEHPGNKQGGGPRVPPPQERPDYGPPSSYQPYSGYSNGRATYYPIPRDLGREARPRPSYQQRTLGRSVLHYRDLDAPQDIDFS